MTKVAILVLQETNTLSLAAAVDPLRAANRHAQRQVFDWFFVTPGTKDVTLTSGLVVPAAPIHRVSRCDVLIILAGFDLQPQATPQLLASLRRLAQGQTRVLAIDGGPWIAAASGILNGHHATTHWEDLDAFADAFPDVETINARYVVSDTRWTSGGAAPALDMVLRLIQALHGSALNNAVAASFIHTSHPAPSDPQLRHPTVYTHNRTTARAHQLMEAHLEHPLSLPDLAARLGISPRMLQLNFRQALGKTAKAHYIALRVAEAHRLLTQTDMPIQNVALATGFPAVSSLSRACAKAFGHAPTTLRRTST